MKNYVEFKSTIAEFKMIEIEGSVFEMGGNDRMAYRDVRKVEVSSFWMGEFAVTQAVWKYVMADTDKENPSEFRGDKRPVENVSWEDIVKEFLPKLNLMSVNNRVENKFYRLPTETEWEYAARGGKYGYKNTFEYAGSSKLEEVGWYNENSYKETKVVGLKTPNLLGLYDMSGNVWEWCNDLIGSGLDRVFRGGSWHNVSYRCHTSRPYYDFSDFHSNYIGFRLVLADSSFE